MFSLKERKAVLSQLRSSFETKIRAEFKYSPILTIIILMAFLVVWSTLYLRTHMDIDMGWLIDCLNRFMVGGTYTNDFYETNPPLSFWIYLPAYPFYTYFGISTKPFIFAVILIYLAFSNITTYCLLKKEKQVTGLDLFVIMSALLAAQSWVAGDVFGSKDHLIAAFLLPISLYQYRITRELNTNTFLAISSIIMGVIAICLKPHYAIIPAFFFIQRLYTKRSLSRCIIAPDFLGMLLIGSFYFVSIRLLTPEYFNLLPQISSVYSADKPFPIYERLHYILYAFLAALGAYFLFTKPEQAVLKKGTYALSTLSLLSLLSFILQDKGYHYQALPLLSYGAAACFIMIYGMIKELTKCKSDIALWGTLAAMIILFGSYTYGNKVPKLTKEQFLNVPIVKVINEQAWNNVYTSLHKLHYLSGLPAVSSLKSGSRFGALWPLTGLTLLANETDNVEKRETIKKQMFEVVDMITADMKRHKPSVLLIPRYPHIETLKPTKGYYKFLMRHDGFKEAINNYTFYDTIVFDVSFAPVGKNIEPLKLVPHDIYVLKRDNAL